MNTDVVVKSDSAAYLIQLQWGMRKGRDFETGTWWDLESEFSSPKTEKGD